MPGLGLQLRVNNLQKRNANATAIPLWDFAAPAAGTIITGFSIQVDRSQATYVQWGDNTSTKSTSRTTTATKTY